MTDRTALLALLAACAGLAQCGGDDYGGGGGYGTPAVDVAIVQAFPQLTFSSPLVFAQAPGDDTRAFVATQSGLIRVFAHDSATTTATTFLDLDPIVTNAGGEMGLLGLAFDPDYATNGFFYVNYNPNFDNTGTNPRRTHISRFQVSSDPDVADASSETVLLSYTQPFGNHKGGWVGFGPDGKLYIASGDGGDAGDPNNNAQNLDSLLGKILRINSDGSVPADNPFVGAAGRDEVWAYGLRNPFRAGFDRVNGELLAGDVGQGSREEIDLIIEGGNYGWRKFEGSLVYNAGDPDPGNAIAPLYEYDHSYSRCSVIGGYTYRGSALTGWGGRYFYADFCTGEVWALTRGATVASTFIGTVPGGPSSFGEDLDGELYITSYNGKVYKLVPA